MAKYATISDGAVYKIRDLTAEQIADIPAHKAAFVLPYFKDPLPAYDNATHHRPVMLDRVIAVDEVRDGWADPVAKTQQEIDVETVATQDEALCECDRDNSLMKAMALVQLDIINGNAPAGPLTGAQYKALLRSKM